MGLGIGKHIRALLLRETNTLISTSNHQASQISNLLNEVINLQKEQIKLNQAYIDQFEKTNAKFDLFFQNDPTAGQGDQVQNNISVHDINTNLDSIRDNTWHSRIHCWDILKSLRLALLGDDQVLSFIYKGIYPVKFYVPEGDVDYVQGHYLIYNNFWESDILEQLNGFVKDKVILDVGANVGNHCVYWSKVSKCKEVHAYEPVPSTYRILKKNIEINEINNVIIHDVALGNKMTKGGAFSTPNNLMMAQIEEDESGDITIRTLDSYEFKAVDFCKVDVEGHSLSFLEGALKTLDKFKPALFIEIFDFEKASCLKILEGLGYQETKKFDADNYLFIHPDRSYEGELNELLSQ